MVKRVPGTLHFTARDEHHSFEHNWCVWHDSSAALLHSSQAQLLPA